MEGFLSGTRSTIRFSSEFLLGSFYHGSRRFSLDIDVTVRHLKPRIGHLEQVEIDLKPRCENGDVPDRLRTWYEYLDDATAAGGKPIRYEQATPEILRQQGFVDVREEVIRLPFNTWPESRHERDIGRWYSLCLCEGLEALSLGPFTRVNRWPPGEVKQYNEEVKEIVCNRKYRLYNNL